jgi:hypothetical protein
MSKLAFCAALVCSFSLQASELFTNGGFESGSLAGWFLISTAPPSDDLFYADNTTSDPVNTFLPTVGPYQGSWYAASDTSGLASPPLESTAIYQSVTIPVGTTDVAFSGAIFVNDWCTYFSGGGSGSCSAGAGGEIAIWANGANPLTAVPIAVLYSADTSTGASGTPNPYTLVSTDVTSDLTAGLTYEIGALESDSTGLINVGIDSFSLVATGSSGVPEPAMLIPTALLGAGMLIVRARRKVRL